MTKAQHIVLVQLFYTLLTAVWPLVHIDSFMAVTGRKTDLWLVKTFSLLLLGVCVCFATALLHREMQAAKALSLSSSVALLSSDLYYTLTGTISYIYLADGLIQLFLLCWWAWIFWGPRSHRHN